MINYLEGTIKNVTDKTITLLVNGVGFNLATPQAKKFTNDQKITLHTYLHWNQEKGPSLFGFETEFERTVFLLIIDCPKIGPSIALNVLTHITPAQFLESITSQNEKTLSSISGIGTKKAEQLIAHLRHKVAKLISTGSIKSESQQSFTQWQHVNEVLSSLNYSRSEINKAMQYLTENHAGENIALDQLIRASLAFLSKGL